MLASALKRLTPLVLVFFLLLCLFPQPLHAQQSQLQDQIQKLKDEIAQLEKDLTTTSKQAQTLETAIRGLDLNIQKLQKSITLTQTQITQKDKEINNLSGDITTTNGKIGDSQQQVADSLRQLDAMEGVSSAVLLLGGGTLSSFFDEAATLGAVRQGLQNRIAELSDLKTDLQTTKTSAEDKRKELASLQRRLSQEKQGLNAARAAQNTLLNETRNKESTYQALIAEKKAQQARFERDLQDYENQLGLNVKAGSIPKAGVLLQWPITPPYVTQYFGNTPFATANAQIYGGKGHNAIDMRASIGTPVKAARGGRIVGTGNTDLTCPNASYGKWVFIEHDNGLSTLYAHLSQINVSQGQSVVGGQVIGYSGFTGYATGPHLHFGLYASSGAKVTSFPSQSCAGRVYTMPVADVSAYLNPLTYLPTL